MTLAPAPTSAAEAAASALELVGTAPEQAASTARAAARLATEQDDAAARSTAQRALGLALRELGDLPGALAALRVAVRSGEQRGLAAPAAEARMSLAWVLLDRGRPAAALHEAERAAGALTGLPAARLKAQRALVLQRTGRLDEALAEFRQALPVLERAGDAFWEGRLRNNRGLLLAYRGALDAAQGDLERAVALFARSGHHRLEAQAIWNLGFVAARRGDVGAALAHYDRTGAALADGPPQPELLTDRAEVLLTAGLAGEARQAADGAAAALQALHRDTDLAEVQLLQAQCALAAGAGGEAAVRAGEAAARFTRQGRPGWALVAGYVRLRAAAASGEPTSVSAAVRLADALAAAGWRDLALDVRLLAARAALGASRTLLAREQLRLASAARSGPVGARIRAWYATALLRDAEGSRRSADAALRAGLRALDDHRATLGATELRIHASSHGEELGRHGLRRALRDRDPARVITWSERSRAGALRLQPVAPPDDPELARFLADLRRVSGELETALLEGRPATALRAERAAVERAVLARSRGQAGSGGRVLAAIGERELRARAAAADRVVLVLVTLDHGLHAVVVGGGPTLLRDLGPVDRVAEVLGHLHFALRRLAGGQGSARALDGARTAALTAALQLDDLLLVPLRHRLRERALVVVPTAALHAVPWALLPSLRGRPVSVAPSATVWARAAALPSAGTTAPGLLVAGPRLPAAAAEVAALSRLHPGAGCLTGRAATGSAVLAGMATAQWAHVAAHGHLRTDNPLFSSLELADGPLTVYDLERLPRVPALIALPACQSAVGTPHAGEEVLGLTGALLGRGARTLVATVIPVPDTASCSLMLDLHAGLAAGRDPAESLADAQAARSTGDPQHLAAVAGFVCLGA